MNALVFTGVTYLILVFIARFSVRQSIVLTLILTLLVIADAKAWLLLTERKPKFQRIQFRIGLTGFVQLLIDANILSEEEAARCVTEEGLHTPIWESLGPYSSGFITFTWLEHDLFFMNTASIFSNRAELTISIRPFGSRALKVGNGLPDCIELRPCVDAVLGGADELV